LLGLVALLLAQDAAGQAAGQPWVRPKSGYYFKFYGSYFLTEEEYNFRGDRQAIDAENSTTSDASFREIAITAYLEYGITDYLTLVSKLPFRILTTEETLTPIFMATPREITRSTGNFSDLTLHLRAPILQGRLALAVQGGAKIPLGYREVPGQGLPAVGTAHLDGELGMYCGWNFYPVEAYVSAGVAYVARGGELHDQVAYQVQAGYTYRRAFFKLQLDGIESTVAPPDLAGTPVVQPGRVDQLQFGDQNVLKLTPVVSYAVTERLSVTGEAYHVLGGENTLAGTTYAVGVVFQR
jgi:hypothetical protein